jgi:dATP pyrophosphohydrolase
VNVRYDMVAVHVVRPDSAGTSHEFLQLRRSAQETLPGAWAIIRGTIDGDERAWQAALRELREETGLRPLEFYKMSLLEMFYFVQDESLWHVPSFCAVVGRDARIVLNDEHDAFRWIPRTEIDEATMWAGERLVVQEVCREILDDGLSKPFLRILFES